jgi:hypothetical protein
MRKPIQSIAHSRGERETDRGFLLSIRQMLEDPTITEITPAILKRVDTRMRKARREYDAHLAENALGPKGVVIPRPAKQLTANKGSK